MKYSEQQIAQLILKHFSDGLTPPDKQVLDSWLAESDQNRNFFNGLSSEEDIIHLVYQEETDMENNTMQNILEKIQHKIKNEEERLDVIQKPLIRRMYNTRRRMWYVAASVLFAISTVLVWNNMNRGKEAHVKPVITQSGNNDALPGFDRAVLTLSSGQQVELGSAGVQEIKDGVLSISNDNGELKYSKSGAAVINTMTTPNGGQYRLTLSDGSKVWLNAGSSITYPTFFSGTKREVNITGEVYFEVARDKTKPFIVQTPGGSHIEVLGTHFNVNTYGDEAYQTTTLIEGKVSVVKLSEKVSLEPGFQAKVLNTINLNGSKNITVVEADVEEATGWRNNLFIFNKADMHFIMRQLSRWYDLDITYKGEIPKRNFIGKIPRDLPLSKMLRTLQLVDVNFEITDKTLVVSGAK